MFFGDFDAFFFYFGDVIVKCLFDVVFGCAKHFKDDSGVGVVVRHGFVQYCFVYKPHEFP